MAAWIMHVFHVSMGIALWFSVKSFTNEITSSSSSAGSVLRIYKKYHSLKKIFNAGSSIIVGLKLLCWIFYIIPFTPIKINESVMIATDWFQFIFHCVYLTQVRTFLVLMSGSSAKVCI